MQKTLNKKKDSQFKFNLKTVLAGLSNINFKLGTSSYECYFTSNSISKFKIVF